MSDISSDTETSTFQLPQDNNSHDSQATQKTVKKKKNKVKKNKNKNQDHENEEHYQHSKTARKKPAYAQAQANTSYAKPQKSKPQSPLFVQQQCCIHPSVEKKFMLSLFLSLICMLLFSQPPQIGYPLAKYQHISHQRAFQFVTDRLTREISFFYEDKQTVAYFFAQTKTAKVRAKINCTLGYRFINFNSSKTNQRNEHISIKMSDLEILQYSINDISLENKDGGFFNGWEFEDHHKLETYIKQKYIDEMKAEVISNIPDHQKRMYQSEAQQKLAQILGKYQNLFNWLLKRINGYVSTGLGPYLQNLQRAFTGRKAIQTE